jgi:TonB family protein
MRLATLVFALLFAGGSAVAQTDAQKSFADRLNSSWKKNVVTLRVFDSRNELAFSGDGTPQGQPKLGAWIFDSKIEVSKVQWKDALQIEGKRLWVFFKGEQMKYAREGGKVKVRIEVLAAATPEQMQSVVNRIFLAPPDTMAEIVPQEWKAYFSGNPHAPKDQPLTDKAAGAPLVMDGRTIYRVGAGVSAPRAIHSPDPEYDERARQMKFQGVVVLWAIVEPDGAIGPLEIVRPLGLGLDEAAVKAVRRWKFEPATKDGKPVAVQINVETNFRLY